MVGDGDGLGVGGAVDDGCPLEDGDGEAAGAADLVTAGRVKRAGEASTDDGGAAVVGVPTGDTVGDGVREVGAVAVGDAVEDGVGVSVGEATGAAGTAVGGVTFAAALSAWAKAAGRDPSWVVHFAVRPSM